MKAKRLEIYCKKTNDFVEYKECFKDSKDIAKFARSFYFDDLELFESFFVILLATNHKPIGWAKISQGGICATLVGVRIIAKYAIDSLATAVALVHNHPSGSLKASKDDIGLTKKIKEALSLFDIKVLDHVILTESDYYSFYDNGML